MATLKRKDGNTWVSVASAGEFPVQIPIKVESIPSPITAGDFPVVINASAISGAVPEYDGTELVNTNLSITIPRNGTYRLKWCTENPIYSSITLTASSCYSRLYKSSDSGSTWTPLGDGEIEAQINTNIISTIDVALNAGDMVSIFFRNTKSTIVMVTIRCGGVSNLMACIDWNPWNS